MGMRQSNLFQDKLKLRTRGVVLVGSLRVLFSVLFLAAVSLYLYFLALYFIPGYFPHFPLGWIGAAFFGFPLFVAGLYVSDS